MVASFYADGGTEARKVPTESELCSLLMPRQLVQLRPDIMSAINESMKQEVEAAPAKTATAQNRNPALRSLAEILGQARRDAHPGDPAYPGRRDFIHGGLLCNFPRSRAKTGTPEVDI